MQSSSEQGNQAVMVTNRNKKMIAAVIEIATAMCMVFVCFMLFTDILAFVFPSRLTTQLTLAAHNEPSVLKHPHWRKLLLSANDKDVELNADGNTAATIGSIQNSVKCKRATSVSWEAVKNRTVLYSHDALQTLSRASALITFDANNQAHLGENTLVVIKQLEDDLVFKGKRAFMLLVEGTLRSKLAPNENKSAYINLETPQATVRMQSSDNPTEARVVAGPEDTSTICVYKGALEVATQNERMTVHASQAIRIPLSSPIEELIALPRPVEPIAPEDLAQLFKKKRHFSTPFSWEPQPDATGYHFMLARDSEFNDLVADATVNTCSYTSKNLSTGTYYWRVSTLINDIEGYFSKTQRLHLIQKLAPPDLLANHPPEYVYFRKQEPTIGFAWRKSPGANLYHWQLARDIAFKKIIMNKRYKTNGFPQEKLGEGIYYWRVGVNNVSNKPISYSPAIRLEVIQDRVPPSLTVDIPTTAIYGQVYLIVGHTDPDAKVFVGGYQTNVSPDGDFKYAMRLKKGKNVIAVAATDPANNVTSKSKIVFCK